MAQSLPEILKVLSKVFKYETSNSSSDTAKLSTTHPSVVQLHGSLTILVQAHTDEQLLLHARKCSERAFAPPLACLLAEI